MNNNYYTQMLLNGLLNTDLHINEIPLIINTVDTSYPLAFIDFEENDTLGVNYTSDDGTERFVVINKKCIINIEVLYQQDIDMLMCPQKTEEDVMYQ